MHIAYINIDLSDADLVLRRWKSRPNKIQVWQAVELLNLMISVKMSARIIFHCKHVPVRKIPVL